MRLKAVPGESVLPDLPESWEGTHQGFWKESPEVPTNSREAMDWVAARPDTDGTPCATMRIALDDAIEVIDGAGSAHETSRRKMYNMMNLGMEGHRGLGTALKTLRRAFLAEFDRRRGADLDDDVGRREPNDSAKREFARLRNGGVARVRGKWSAMGFVGDEADEFFQPCGCNFKMPTDNERVKSPAEYEYTDVGNAEQLIDLMDGDLIWTPEDKDWLSWSEEERYWVGSKVNIGMQRARRIAPRVKAAGEAKAAEAKAAQERGDDHAHKIANNESRALLGHAKKCGSASGLKNMLEVAQSYDEVVQSRNNFDTRKDLLHCGEGTVLELRASGGVLARPGEREDLISHSTGTPYVHGATHPLWDSYLDTFIPDKELRWWVQRLFGYSLYGDNHEGIMAFLHGEGSSGKSTILEAVSTALGDYAAPFSLSLFRERQDPAAPRPDVVHALPKRLIYSTEASAVWRLHEDAIKRATGGDRQSARLNYSNVYHEREPAATPIVGTNNPVTVEGAGQALRDRLFVVPFEERLPREVADGRARQMLKEDPAARVAVLAWLVTGWEAYAAEGLRQDVPERVLEKTEAFFGAVSEVHEWFYSTYEITGSRDNWVEVDMIWTSWEVYMHENRLDQHTRTNNKRALGHWLTSQGLAPAEKKRIGGDGTPPRVRYGIRARRGR